MKTGNHMKALWGIYVRGLLILRARWNRNLISVFLSPALYALAFGWGLGRNMEVEGTSYLYFLLPGLIAISGMNQSFSVASEINISRFFTHFFEEYLLSPAHTIVIVLGNVLYGITKGMASFFAVFIIGAVFGVLPVNVLMLFVPVLLNTFMFASLSIWIALAVKNHRDMSAFTSFVIVPMSFIAGTFFSLKTLPWFLIFLTKLIPLTHASLSIRAVFLGKPAPYFHFLVIGGYALFFFFMAVRQVRKAVL
jgi:ABC-2 type transport system permease protein